MPRKQYKYHFIYKTINKMNNKFYIGMHSTSNLEDGYLGSGKKLRYAINKYGKENFQIERIRFFETRIELEYAERDIVNKNLLKDPLCMNLIIGGCGGFTEEARLKGSKLGNISFKEKLKDPEYKLKIHQILSKAQKEAYKKGTQKANHIDWTGKKHTNESKMKMSNSKKGKGLGEENSMFGKHHTEESKEKIRNKVKDNCKKIFHVYDKNGNFISEENGIGAYAKKNNISRFGIINVLKGRQKHYKDLIFSYTNILELKTAA